VGRKCHAVRLADVSLIAVTAKVIISLNQVLREVRASAMHLLLLIIHFILDLNDLLHLLFLEAILIEREDRGVIMGVILTIVEV
jgi:hypothetical protein